METKQEDLSSEEKQSENRRERSLWFSQYNGKKELLLKSDTCSDFKYNE